MIDLSLFTTTSDCDKQIATFNALINQWSDNTLSAPIIQDIKNDIARLMVHRDQLCQPNQFFYNITTQRGDSKQLIQVMEKTAHDLNIYGLQGEPIGLIGQIQSGKTRAFNGIMAKCFDYGFDIAILFTKSSVALVEQTIKRLKNEFQQPISNNELEIFNAITTGRNLSSYQATNHKNIIVTKKESKNLEVLLDLFNGSLKGKKVLLVDDEADIVSMTYKPNAQQQAQFAECADKLDKIRKCAKGSCAYLQVTATPYCLYLQPVTGDLNNIGYEGLRPCKTHILYPHSAYIGGKFYFEDSKTAGSVASKLFSPVSDTEIKFLNKDKKKNKTTYAIPLGTELTDKRICAFRKAVFTFLISGAVRYLSDQTGSYRCACLIHTKTSQDIHFRQKELYDKILNEIEKDGASNFINNKEYISAYNDLSISVKASGIQMPSLQNITNRIFVSLVNKEINVVIVNSNRKTQNIRDLLDDDGQLKLTHPYNVFIGAQSLDRGVTINNLICMMYGRNTNQMDTVLQHSRMYGARSKEDISVTRFFTTQEIHSVMEKMHSFDNDLRRQLELNEPIVFVAKEGTRIVPCGPSKIRASVNMVSYKAGSFMLPVGFDVRNGISTITAYVQSSIKGLKVQSTFQDYTVYKCDYNQVANILNLINTAYLYHRQDSDYKWDIDGQLAAIKNSMNNKGEILVYETNRTKSDTRIKQDGEFNDTPYDGKTDSPNCKALALDTPVVMMLRIKGEVKKGWHGEEFYWPVIVIPQNSKHYVYMP